MRFWSVCIFVSSLLLGAALGSCALPPRSVESEAEVMRTQPNLPFPTLGGRQLWVDVHWYAGWRVQQHVWTKHARLLDRHNVRRAWGSLEACESALQKARERKELELQSTNIVVVVHGLGRSRASMSALRKRLRQAGYEVLDFGYPSTRRSLQEHAEQLRALVDRLAAEGVERFDFVTHSLGGMVVREAMQDPAPWEAEVQLGRLVMLAPPSQGSAIAEALKDFVPFRWLMGEVGPQLAYEEAARVPAPRMPFAIIAAQRGDGGGWNPLLSGEDDGVVTVEETKLAGMEDFYLVRGLHTFVMSQTEVLDRVLHYLEHGRFSPAPEASPQ